MKRQSIIVLLAALAGTLLATSAMAQSLRVSPERLVRYWLLATQALDADVPNSGRGLDKPGCAAVSYTIGADGVTRHLKVQKVVPATSDFASIAISVVRQFHYVPGPDNTAQRPVTTYYVVPFNLAKTADGGKRITAACALPGY